MCIHMPGTRRIGSARVVAHGEPALVTAARPGPAGSSQRTAGARTIARVLRLVGSARGAYARVMLPCATLVMWLVQPPLAPALVPVTPPPREWNLAGKFTLKQETFLRWHAVVDPTHPYRGLYSEQRPTYTLELTPTHTKLRDFSLMIESLPAFGAGVGVVRPKLMFRVPGTQFRIGLGVNLRAFHSSGRRP